MVFGRCALNTHRLSDVVCPIGNFPIEGAANIAGTSIDECCDSCPDGTEFTATTILLPSTAAGETVSIDASTATISPPELSTSDADPCVSTIELASGGVVDFTGQYDNNQDCSWFIECASGHVEVEFTSFNVRCGDYVNLYDGRDSSAPEILQKCGNNVQESFRYQQSSGTSVFMQFTSNSWGTRDGFALIASCPAELCTSEATCEELGWSNIGGSDTVCRESRLAHNGVVPTMGPLCHGADTSHTSGFLHAVAVCDGVGARLCTVAELQVEDADGPGCPHDASQVWSSSPCSDYLGMKSYGGNREVCNRDLRENLAVKCCADSVRTDVRCISSGVQCLPCTEGTYDHDVGQPVVALSWYWEDDFTWHDIRTTGVSVREAEWVSASAVTTANTVCTFTPGDGSGGSEEWIGEADSAQACAALAQEGAPGANGVTYPSNGGTSCYAEFGMSSVDSSWDGWQSCFFETTAAIGNPAADDGYAIVELPFSFPYFGIPETELHIGTNGYLTFGNGAYTTGDTQRIPTAGGLGDHPGVDSIIAAWWTDVSFTIPFCDPSTLL